jgi:hypothetical protein
MAHHDTDETVDIASAVVDEAALERLINRARRIAIVVDDDDDDAICHVPRQYNQMPSK